MDNINLEAAKHTLSRLVGKGLVFGVFECVKNANPEETDCLIVHCDYKSIPFTVEMYFPFQEDDATPDDYEVEIALSNRDFSTSASMGMMTAADKLAQTLEGLAQHV